MNLLTSPVGSPIARIFWLVEGVNKETGVADILTDSQMRHWDGL
jgi:hypothetical protein